MGLAEQPGKVSSRKEYLWVGIFLLGLLIVFFWKPLFGNYSMVPADILYYEDWFWVPYKPAGFEQFPANAILGDQTYSFYPWYYYTAEQLRAGHIPLWNPYLSSGTPLLANLQSGIFDPIRFFLLFLFPIYKVPVLQSILRLFIAGFFMYVFVRKLGLGKFSSLVSMVSFTFCGFMITFLGHTDIGVACWLPLLFCLIEEWLVAQNFKYLLCFSFVIGLQFLAGHVETSFHIIIALIVYFIFRWVQLYRHGTIGKRWTLWLGFALAGIGGLLLAAVQIIPFLEFLSNSSIYIWRSTASTGLVDWGAFIGEIPVFWEIYQSLLLAFYPDLLGNPMWHNYRGRPGSDYNEGSIYIGLIPILIVIFFLRYYIRRRKYIKSIPGMFPLAMPVFFAILGITTLGISLQAPIFNIFNHIPPFDVSSNTKFRFIYAFCMAIVAGYGMEFLFLTQTLPNAKKYIETLLKMGLIFLVITGILSLLIRLIPYWDYLLPSSQYLFLESLTIPLILLISFLAVIGFYYKNIISKTLFKTLLFILIIIDLFVFGKDYNPSFPLNEIYPAVQPMQFLKSHLQNDRVAGFGAVLRPNSGLIHHISDIRNCDPMRVYWYDLYLLKYLQAEILWYTYIGVTHLNPTALDFLNVKYVLTHTPLESTDTTFKLVYKNPAINIYENSQVLPRAFFVTDDTKGSLKFPITDEPIGERTMIVRTSIHTLQVTGHTEIRQYEPEKVQIETSSAEDGYLILSDTWFPGWKCTLDQKEVKILCANYAFRGVKVTKGNHEIVFTYEPYSFKLGWITSLVTLGILLLIYLLRYSIPRKTLFSFFITVLFFLILELIFRIIPGFNPLQGPLMIKGPFTRTDVFESDPELFWRFIPNKVIPGFSILINNLGFRGENYDPVRYSNYNRILCLGDSCTFGGEVGLGQTYVERLAYYLNSFRPNPLYKALNFGVPGYSSYQILHLYRHYVDLIKPSTVIVWTASNDRDLAIYYPDKEFEKQEANAYLLRNILRQSHFCVFLATLISKFQNQEFSHEKQKIAIKKMDDKFSRVSLDDYRANLQEIIDISRQHHIRLILMTRHWYIRDRLLDKYNSTIRELATKNNVEVVDLAQLFLRPGFAKYYNRPADDWVHLNQEGYDLVGQEAAKEVLSPIRYY